MRNLSICFVLSTAKKIIPIAIVLIVAIIIFEIILKGNKFYHIAYETKNIEKDLKIFIEEKRAKVIVPITEATYFDKICFMVMPNMMLIELVQLKELNNG